MRLTGRAVRVMRLTEKLFRLAIMPLRLAERVLRSRLIDMALRLTGVALGLTRLTHMQARRSQETG